MAITTLEQRRSLVSWSRPWLPQLPKPNGAVNKGDRYQLAWLYRSPSDIGVVCLPYLAIRDLSPALKSVDMIVGVELDDLAPGIFSQDC